MVAQCAVSWGASIEPQGKVVWFEPSPTMHEDDSAELVIDRTDSATPEPTSDAAVKVKLLGLDVPLYSSLARQYTELRRELRLLSLSHQSDYPLAGDLTAMFSNFERQFPESYAQQITAAETRGLPRVDVVFPMVPEAGPIFVTMTEMFDVADAFCRAERLLSLARTPRQRDLHVWLLGELIGQLDGGQPPRLARLGSRQRPRIDEPGRVSSSRLRSVDLLLVAAGGAVGALARCRHRHGRPGLAVPLADVGRQRRRCVPAGTAARAGRRTPLATRRGRARAGRARRFHDGLRLGRGRAGAGRCRTCRGGRALPRGDAGRRPGRRRPRPEDVAPAGARGAVE